MHSVLAVACLEQVQESSVACIIYHGWFRLLLFVFCMSAFSKCVSLCLALAFRLQNGMAEVSLPEGPVNGTLVVRGAQPTVRWICV